MQDILFLGMLAVSSLTVSFFCEYTYVPILFPFLLSMLSFGVGAAVGYAPLAMFHIISPAQTRGMSLGVIGAEFSLLLLIGGGYFYAGYKKGTVLIGNDGCKKAPFQLGEKCNLWDMNCCLLQFVSWFYMEIIRINASGGVWCGGDSLVVMDDVFTKIFLDAVFPIFAEFPASR